MSDCEHVQQAIVEGVAASAGRDPRWEEVTARHLRECALCREVLEQELELSQYLEEPLPLPPSDLIANVMAKVREENKLDLQEHMASRTRPEAGLPWAERFAWAASGAAAMFSLERLPSLSAQWLTEAQLSLFGWLSSLEVGFEVNWLYLIVLGLGLLAAQGAMVYQVRSSGT